MDRIMPNIKDAETHPDPVRCDQVPELASRLLEIGKDCAAHLKEPFRSVDHSELLYQENGLA
jgi:antitoxin VapB